MEDASYHAPFNNNGRRHSRLSNQTTKLPCFCGDSNPPERHALPINHDESGVEALLRLFGQIMAFWERLKTCRPCLEAHASRLLDMVETVTGFLRLSIADGAVSSVVPTVPRTPSSPSLAAALESPPLMALGQFTLDDQQGAVLISSVYRRMLRQIASMLDEMQQIEHHQHLRWENDLGNYLIPVLQLLEVM